MRLELKLRMLRTMADRLREAAIRAMLNEHLAAEPLAIEAAYFEIRPGFKRPYGWGWALMLVHETSTWDDPDAKRWAANLAPLGEALTTRYVEWLPKATYPVYLVDLLPGIMLTSIGMGLTFVPVTLIATSGIPDDDAGLASGLFNTSQQIGGALGLAVLSTIATRTTTDAIESLGREPSKTDTAGALVDGFQDAWLGSAALLAVGAALLLALLRRRDVVAASHGEAAPVVA